ncbi:MAG: STAS domain-containing protein [Candidatus Promineifilaceae bacterium]
MSVHQSAAGDVWIVVVSGRLDQLQISDLENRLSQLLADSHARLLVDLSEVTYMNSGGLRCLLTGWRQARKLGGNLALCGLNQRLQDLFSLVGFDKVFNIYPTCLAAQQALGSE